MQIMSLGYELWQWLLILGLLIPESVYDIKYKKIHPALTISFVLLAQILYGFTKATSCADFILNLLPGFLVIIMAFIFKESMGLGDGLIILFIGSVCGLRHSVFILVIAFVMSAVVSLLLLALRKVNRKSKLPFVPFLLMASLICGGIT